MTKPLKRLAKREHGAVWFNLQSLPNSSTGGTK